MTICIDIYADVLSEKSMTYRVAVADDETPPGEVVSFDAVSETDAISLADGIADLVRKHTNHGVDWPNVINESDEPEAAT